MALERLQRRSCDRVPEPHYYVVRPGHDLRAVRRERYRRDRMSVALERL